MLLFGGALTVHHEAGVVSVDTKLHFKASVKARLPPPRRFSPEIEAEKKEKMKDFSCRSRP